TSLFQSLLALLASQKRFVLSPSLYQYFCSAKAHKFHQEGDYIVRKLSSKFLTNAHSLLQGNFPDHLQASHYFLVLDHKRCLSVLSHISYLSLHPTTSQPLIIRTSIQSLLLYNNHQLKNFLTFQILYDVALLIQRFQYHWYEYFFVNF